MRRSDRARLEGYRELLSWIAPAVFDTLPTHVPQLRFAHAASPPGSKVNLSGHAAVAWVTRQTVPPWELGGILEGPRRALIGEPWRRLRRGGCPGAAAVQASRAARLPLEPARRQLCPGLPKPKRAGTAAAAGYKSPAAACRSVEAGARDRRGPGAPGRPPGGQP